MGGQSVGGVHVQGLVAHHDVLHAVVAVHLHELALIAEHHGGGYRGVDGVADAGHLQEAAVLLGVQPGAHLQGVQDVLAGGLHQAGLVAEGVHVDDVLVGDVAGSDVGPDAAAVHKGDVGVQHDTVGVGAQVAQVGLGIAHGAIAGGGVQGGEGHVALGHDLLQHGGKLLVHAGHVGGHGLVLLVVAGHQLGGDVAGLGVDDHLAQVGKLGAGLGQDHVLAVLVLDGLVIGLVGVAVDEHVDAGGVGDHGLGGPHIGGALVAQVAQGHHVVGAVGHGGVHGLLHSGVEVSALVALAEAVDILALLVLEVGGGGLGEGLGGVNAHVAHAHVAVVHDLIGVQNGLPLQVGEVAAQIGVLRLLLSQGQEVVHTIVELVVAGDGQVIAHLVHDVHDVGPLGQGADGAALDGVARVHQGHVLRPVLGLHLGLVGRHAGVAQIGYRAGLLIRDRIDPAVHIVGVQDHDLAALALFCRHGGRSQAHDHGCRQEQREHLLLHFPVFHLSACF